MRGASLSPRGKAEAEGAQAGESGDGSAAAAGEQQGTPGKPEEEADSSAPLSPVSELSPRESGFSPRGSRDGEYAALIILQTKILPEQDSKPQIICLNCECNCWVHSF